MPEQATGSVQPPLVVVRPIVFTTAPQAWLELLHALGAEPLVTADGWRVLRTDAGRVAVHATAADDPLAGVTRLGFETPDLDAFLAARAEGIRAAGAHVSLEQAGHGPTVAIRAADGLELFVDPLTPDPHAGASPMPAIPAPASGDSAQRSPTIEPIWYTPQVGHARAVLEAIGLRPHILSEAGRWVQLLGEAGQQAVHIGDDTGTVMAFEHPDIEVLQGLLRTAGVEADLIDENYGRSLRLPHPELPDLDARLWVNEVQRDLYGYRKLSAQSG